MCGAKGTVGSLLPDGCERYLRIPHSAVDPSGADVTWKAVTEVTDRAWHSLMEWEMIRSGSSGQEWVGEAPATGSLADGQREVLYPLLEHSQSGFSDVLYGFNLNVFWGEASLGALCEDRLQPFSLTSIDSVNARIGRRAFVFLAGRLSSGEPALELDGRWIELPWYEYVVSAACDWCIASSGDLDSSYLACSDPVAATILSEPGIEAMEVALSESIAAGSDRINLPVDKRT